MVTSISLEDIRNAGKRIAGRTRRTPLVMSPSLSEIPGAEIWLKCEHHQVTGSFKVRGATNAVLSLTEDQRAKGIVGVSTGNHGRGLAYAAREAGARCIICMSKLVPANKVTAIEAEGADVCITGRSQDEAQKEVDRRVRKEGMVMLPPFDHPDIIAGQGTLGVEIYADMPDLDTVLVPLSGGGLISGVAIALKSLNRHIRVVGVSMERGAAMIASQNAGHAMEVEELPTLADSLGGGVGLDNRYTFNIVRDYVDELVTVSEEEIAEAIRHAYWQEKQIIEGSGSVGIAALLSRKIGKPGKCAVLLSGCNIDMMLHKRIIDGENVDIGRELSGKGKIHA